MISSLLGMTLCSHEFKPWGSGDDGAPIDLTKLSLPKLAEVSIVDEDPEAYNYFDLKLIYPQNIFAIFLQIVCSK